MKKGAEEAKMIELSFIPWCVPFHPRQACEVTAMLSVPPQPIAERTKEYEVGCRGGLDGGDLNGLPVPVLRKRGSLLFSRLRNRV